MAVNPIHIYYCDFVEIIPIFAVLPVEAIYSDIYANTPPQKIRGTTIDATVEQQYLTTAEIVRKLGREPKSY
jgi:hypothetical protein